MSMNSDYLDAVADFGGSLITHLGLVDHLGAELSGGIPAYARLPVTWTPAAGGLIRPSSNLVFDVPDATTVAGWRGYSADSGGTDYGGAALTPEAFAAQGEYTLLAASTGIRHDAA